MSAFATALLRACCLCLPVLLCASGCSYAVRNAPANVIGGDVGYRIDRLQASPHGRTLVLVTVSGGGTRATALALSVLRGLHAVRLPDGATLAQRIDVISSVSGGSVAAAYFALAGPAGFDALEQDFVRRDGITPLVVGFLNPIGLVRYSTPRYERIDLLIDYLDRQLFHGATYQSLLDCANRRAAECAHRPLLVLNAADMVEGVPFPFTQRKFELLCSDLPSFPLATAVAASAAFPIVLSPVTLTNHSPCAAQRAQRWPPAYVDASIDQTQDEPSLWYDDPQRATLARTELAYALGGAQDGKRGKRFVHLLDGGIADNLGIAEPLRMLTTRDTEPSFLAAIDRGEIERLIVVTINARSFADSALDADASTPGILDMLIASTSSPIDRAAAGSAQHLRVQLQETFRNLGLADPTNEARFATLAEHTALIAIDFDAIVNSECRRRFHNIPTSWTLKPRQIDALLAIGGALLASDPEFPALLELSGGVVQEGAELPNVQHACALL